MDEKSVSFFCRYKLIMSSVKKYICKNIGCEDSFAYRSQKSSHAQKYLKEKPQKSFSENADGTFKCTKSTKVVKQKQHPETPQIM